MKRLVVIALLSVFLAGCVNQSDYDDLVKKNEKLEKKVDSLEEENDDLRAEIKQLKEKPVETPATPSNEANAETTNDTDLAPFFDENGNLLMDIYDKTFTNPESGSTITITMEYVNDGVWFSSTYQMPPHSYFDNDYQAEGAAGVYCGYILTILENNYYTTAFCKSDEYYNTSIVTAENDDGYLFMTSSRNGSVAIYDNERDWYLDFAADMDNKRYASSELAWIVDTFNTYTNDLQEITAKIKELK